MVGAILELLALVLEPLLWLRFGPRHEWPRSDMHVLGDISPLCQTTAPIRRHSRVAPGTGTAIVA